MKKLSILSEVVYPIGLFLIALGVALWEASDLGMSMLILPAYLLFRKLSPVLSFFSFGVAEFCFQLMLLGAMTLMLRRFRLRYLLSFLTVAIYGIFLDICMRWVTRLSDTSMLCRILLLCLAMCCSTAGIALLLHTYFPPQIYELFVKEISRGFHLSPGRVKTTLDLSCFALSIGMGLLLFPYEKCDWISIGTFAAIFNGGLLNFFNCILKRYCHFYDGFSLRAFFEK